MTGDRQHDRFGPYALMTGHEGTGRCWWCGGEFSDKRYRRYCCQDCADAYGGQFSWPIASARAIRVHPYCEDCGEQLKRAKAGSLFEAVPRNLEVHHIDPLNGEDRNSSVKNRPENLVVLCHECHMERHHPKPDLVPQLPLPLFDYAGVEV